MAEALARLGADVIGIDPSQPALKAARCHAETEGLCLKYSVGRGEQIPLANESVDVVVCVDVLEHVEDLEKVIQEVRRVLKPNGLLCFDTINRTWLASLVIVSLGEKVLRLLPCGTHDPEKFIKPRELSKLLAASGLKMGSLVGLGPVGLNRKLDFTFGKHPSLSIMYMGHADVEIRRTS